MDAIGDSIETRCAQSSGALIPSPARVGTVPMLLASIVPILSMNTHLLGVRAF